MTDPQPDDLYDALRDRLADYGQEPPARLWAGIRAQLPPPVAPPQLRNRRRRWSPVLLLGLLLAVVGGAGWQWWRAAGPGQSAAGTGQVAVNGKRSETNAAGTASVPPQTAAELADAAEAGPNSPAIRASANPATATQATDFTTAENASPAFPKRKDLASVSRAAADARGRRPFATRPGTFSEGRSDAAYARPDTHPSGAVARKPAVGASSEAGKEAVRQESTSEENKSVGMPFAPAEVLAAGTYFPASPSGALAKIPAPRADKLALQSLPGSPQTGTNKGASATSGSAPGTAAADAMPRRTPVLFLAEFPLPTARLGSDTVPALPVVARRWAVQLLGGPAQTFRTLGASAGSGPVANRNSPPGAAGFTNRDNVPNALAKKEQSSTGFGLQVQARRRLNGRWGVSAGLGYQEYATKTDYSGPIAYTTYSALNNPTRASQEVNLSQRDTYRFATVPLRVSYALGPASKRLRYGLLAGTDVAVYLGGSSTGQFSSSAPNKGDYLYRPLSVSVMAGLDLHYRVGPRLELLAQPNATYFLTSLPKPVSGLTPRYLWSAGALFGVSYDLR